MKKIILVLASVVVVVLAVGAWLFLRGPDLSAYEKFREPALIQMPAQKVVVVEGSGAPEQTAAQCLPILFKIYFSLKDVPKYPMPAPRSRWPVSTDVPQSQWVGRFAMPVPDSVTSLPADERASGPRAQLVTWEYGDVAQILHVGRYDQEKPTVERLSAFISAQGYQAVGEHEEEYLRGPGLLGKGDPETYYTLIRYQVRKPVQ
jgi:effector-binding domain-containing protein